MVEKTGIPSTSSNSCSSTQIESTQLFHKLKSKQLPELMKYYRMNSFLQIQTKLLGTRAGQLYMMNRIWDTPEVTSASTFSSVL